MSSATVFTRKKLKQFLFLFYTLSLQNSLKESPSKGWHSKDSHSSFFHTKLRCQSAILYKPAVPPLTTLPVPYHGEHGKCSILLLNFPPCCTKSEDRVRHWKDRWWDVPYPLFFGETRPRCTHSDLSWYGKKDRDSNTTSGSFVLLFTLGNHTFTGSKAIKFSDHCSFLSLREHSDFFEDRNINKFLKPEKMRSSSLQKGKLSNVESKEINSFSSFFSDNVLTTFFTKYKENFNHLVTGQPPIFWLSDQELDDEMKGLW